MEPITLSTAIWTSLFIALLGIGVLCIAKLVYEIFFVWNVEE